jgi:hypothetical protein
MPDSLLTTLPCAAAALKTTIGAAGGTVDRLVSLKSDSLQHFYETPIVLIDGTMLTVS